MPEPITPAELATIARDAAREVMAEERERVRAERIRNIRKYSSTKDAR